MKRLLLTLPLVLGMVFAQAQGFSRLRDYVEVDYTRTSKWSLSENIAMEFRNNRGHAFTFGYHLGQHRHDFNLAYQIALFQDSRERLLFVENRYLYRLFPKYKLQEFNAMLSMGWRTAHWSLKLGLCNRYIAEVPLRKDGGQGTIFEPLNVVFDVQYNVFPETHPWNVGLGISNQREFIIERVTLFYYHLHGYYNVGDNFSIIAEAGVHPSGVLNLSAQPNGFYTNIGIIYIIDNPTINYKINRK